MTASTNVIERGRVWTIPRFEGRRPLLRRRATAGQLAHVQELLRLHPRAPAAIPVCPGGVLDHELLRSWNRSAVAWLIYEIESAPYNQ